MQFSCSDNRKINAALKIFETYTRRTAFVMRKSSDEQVAAILVENNASLKAATKNGFTPLHIAAKYGNMNVANILLQKESKLDVQGKVRARIRT